MSEQQFKAKMIFGRWYCVGPFFVKPCRDQAEAERYAKVRNG